MSTPTLLGIIADDLSGACDTGLQFAKHGLKTAVMLEPGPAPAGAQVLVADTDSRTCAAEEAHKRVSATARWLASLGATVAYKKIDSTIRGNLGAELDGLLESSGATALILTPAFPAAGRTVRDGNLILRGAPLADTEFARDPLWPAKTSSVRDAVLRQSRSRVIELPIRAARAGAMAVVAALNKALESEPGPVIAIADAETSEDLACLAVAIAFGGGDWIGVGSAGLAEHLPSALGLAIDSHGEKADPLGTPSKGHSGRTGALVVAGSLNPLTKSQASAVVDSGAASVLVPVAAALDPDWPARAKVPAREAVHQLLAGRDVVLGLSSVDPEGFRIEAARRGLYAVDASQALVDALGTVVRQIADEGIKPAGLALTGGDTARAVCRALGCRGLVILKEVRPGIPFGFLADGVLAGLPVVTKAGGFGAEDALVAAVRLIRQAT